MTENKRFENRLNRDIKKFHALNPVWDNELKDAWNVFEMIDLLNKYDKEYLDCHNDVLRLEKENEKLKNKLKFFMELNKPYGDIIKENEQLKQQNKMLRTNVGKLTDDVNYLRNLPSTHQKENKQLKVQLEICKDARQAYKQDWKACVSYCDTYKDEIHTLKDNIQGLIEENKLYKERISLLSSLLDLADAIIDTSDNEKAKQVWDNKNEQIEKEWEKILNG